MTIFESIRKDHDTQRELLDQLIKTSGDSSDRDILYKKLKNQLDIHAQAEERHFYKPLISNDMMQEKARHGIAEHHEIDELIEQLDNTDYSSSAWLKTAKDLKEKVEHHLEDEEHTFFQLAGKVFTDKQKEDLAEAYKSYMHKNL
ncbi:hemerythrin domain-containing protein [Olleya aquimaris]|uniref:Hemerythrin HHE cation binding domain-containing protein n=1 Tax=Olleya aquimaris TaxID=639310 RepID=A0A327RMK0_9FLAO|nr:hemerythrin domain-containing protein [Olleya aquimaris]RAJ16813.1 hemerythrin HHE cation binding domain-containing protein [Olleya aquimaris]